MSASKKSSKSSSSSSQCSTPSLSDGPSSNPEASPGPSPAATQPKRRIPSSVLHKQPKKAKPTKATTSASGQDQGGHQQQGPRKTNERTKKREATEEKDQTQTGSFPDLLESSQSESSDDTHTEDDDYDDDHQDIKHISQSHQRKAISQNSSGCNREAGSQAKSQASGQRPKPKRKSKVKLQGSRERSRLREDARPRVCHNMKNVQPKRDNWLRDFLHSSDEDLDDVPALVDVEEEPKTRRKPIQASQFELLMSQFKGLKEHFDSQHDESYPWQNPKNKRVAQQHMGTDKLLKDNDVTGARTLIKLYIKGLKQFDAEGDITKFEKTLKKGVKAKFTGKRTDELMNLLKVPDFKYSSYGSRTANKRQPRQPRTQYAQATVTRPRVQYVKAQEQEPAAPAASPRLAQAAVTIQHVGMDKEHCTYCTAAGSAQPHRCHFLKKNPTAQTIVLT